MPLGAIFRSAKKGSQEESFLGYGSLRGTHSLYSVYSLSNAGSLKKVASFAAVLIAV